MGYVPTARSTEYVPPIPGRWESVMHVSTAGEHAAGSQLARRTLGLGAAPAGTCASAAAPLPTPTPLFTPSASIVVCEYQLSPSFPYFRPLQIGPSRQWPASPWTRWTCPPPRWTGLPFGAAAGDVEAQQPTTRHHLHHTSTHRHTLFFCAAFARCCFRRCCGKTLPVNDFSV